MTRFVACAVLLTLTLTLLGCQKTKPPAPAAPVAPAVTVKAGDLLEEYGSNAAAADTKYKGKIIQVSGKAGQVQNLPLLGYVLTLYGDDSGDAGMTGVQAIMAESATNDVAKVTKGQTVTVQGKCDMGTLGQVKMSQCTIVNK
jgi:hypothetical protein